MNPTTEPIEPESHPGEPHDPGIAGRLNWLRAGVLGANDGIVSTAGIVVGVTGATTDTTSIAIAGIAGLVAGAMSMAAGEYVSVSTQRDSERALLAKEARELREDPDAEFAELVAMLEQRGISPDVAREAARDLTRHDALAAHAEIELGLDPDGLTNPWHAAWASMVAFTLGALLPLLVMTLTPPDVRLVATVTSVMLALAATGWVSARLGQSPPLRALVRNVLGGLAAMGVTYLIGMIVGTRI
ncbi:VIT1/CCC1 transporter family protein [Nocardioides sp. GXZ039]|uniref:VIT1/CCC1 transporter family protein n=1 Tax=Nocardioides sp. GXZ039 TaxID=3136018 RepID=UPI0030F4833A